jgi:DNA repair protein RadC
MKPNNNIPAMTGVAEVQLVYHNKVKTSDRPTIRTAKDAYQLLLDHWNKDTIELAEEFKVILMNTKSSVLGIYNLSKGGISGTIADSRLVYIAALRAAASSIILAHNHPSGDANPSKTDEAMTQKLKAGAALLDIRLSDHLIVTPETYFSFANEGLL